MTGLTWLGRLTFEHGFMPDDVMQDLHAVLERHGLPPVSSDVDAIVMQGALFQLLYGDLGHSWGS